MPRPARPPCATCGRRPPPRACPDCGQGWRDRDQQHRQRLLDMMADDPTFYATTVDGLDRLLAQESAGGAGCTSVREAVARALGEAAASYPGAVGPAR